MAAPELLVWAGFILLSPFYVMPNGRPQPADIVSLALLPLLMRGQRPRMPAHWRRVVLALAAFCGYVVAVNAIWGVLLLDRRAPNIGAVSMVLFYVFNAYIFVAGVLLYVRHGARFIAVTVWATVLTAAGQVFLLALSGGDDYRESLFFNNPNQLGYFTLLAASTIAFAYTRARVRWWVAGSAIAGAALLAALSLSKAAMFGLAFVALAAALRKPALLAVAAGVLLVGASLRDPAELLQKVDDRMAGIGASDDDTLEGRGFTRITMYPEYLAFGAGEVGYDRYGSFAGELHSSWATVLFSYGVVGFVLFLRFLTSALRHLRWPDVLFLLPTVFYGFTHQGLRFRFFWVFLAVVSVVTYHAAAERRRGTDTSRARVRALPRTAQAAPA